MSAVVVGRDEEFEALRGFVARPSPDGPIAIELEGEAGIGKSTLWRAAVEHARDRGLRVLTAQPAESEALFAYAGLGDLLDGVLDDVLPRLSPPQRRALEVVLLIEDADEIPVDVRTLGVATRNVLRLLAEDGLLVAVDDVQWLDASSASTLAFALRRLQPSQLLVLLTRRVGMTGPPALEDSFSHVERLHVGPLSVGALHQVLRDALETAIPRPTLLRLHEESGGNPFYALELARALDPRRITYDPTQPLPVPDRLESLISARLAGFTGATRDALALASAHARLDESLLRRGGVPEGALAPALEARVVELTDGTVRFTHPLFASVVYQGLTDAERMRTHRVLADAVDDPLSRARHLALAANAPDSELAQRIERAADSAIAQGAPFVAAELGEHALRLTPAGGPDADRLTAKAARQHAAAGEVERARHLALTLVERTPTGEGRGDALALLAEIETESLETSIALLEEALREPDVPVAVRVRLHGRLSRLLRFKQGLAAAEAHALAAIELAEELDDDDVRASALASLALTRFNAGEEDALPLAEEAQRLAGDVPSRGSVDAGFALAHVLAWSGDLVRARELLEHLLDVWSERDERLSGYALWYLALVELRAGDLDRASELAARSLDLSLLYSREGEESPTSFFMPAVIAAHRGELDEARALADRMLQVHEHHGTRLLGPGAVLATIQLWSGDAEAAVEWFARAEAVTDPVDQAEPNMAWWRAEQIEALLAVGRGDEAVELLNRWESDARRLDRRWALAQIGRCRGLVAAAAGKVQEALALLEEAVRSAEAADDPFGRGRALLALGATRRRARQKKAGRDALEEARQTFDRMGARGWSDRAAEELGRIGGRTRAEGLTPAELRVAELVAKGRTNAETAAELFLAERTVASHLTHVYAKLGVRSRTELARKLD